MTENNPEQFDVGLLSDIVTWAVVDSQRAEMKDQFPQFSSWGSWVQTSWASGEQESGGNLCQTAFCIAGQAAAQGGYMLYTEIDPDRSGTFYADYCGVPIETSEVDDKGRVIRRLDEDNLELIASVARRLLGITTEEDDALFDGDNEIEDVVTVASYFARSRGVSLNCPDWVMEYDRGMDDDMWYDRTGTAHEVPTGALV